MINATNIQPSQRNRRINRWIELLQAFPLCGDTSPDKQPS
jgi:hypothetical protein